MGNYPKTRKPGAGFSNKGIVRSLEFRQKVSNSMKGRQFSDEHRANLSKALMGNTVRGKGWTHPEEVRQKISEGMRGEKNWNWQGGIYKTHRDIRRSPTYKRWRLEILTRDNYECQICGQQGGKLNANHIVRFADSEKLRFVQSNGVTLCIRCHKLVTWNEKEWESYFKINVFLKEVA